MRPTGRRALISRDCQSRKADATGAYGLSGAGALAAWSPIARVGARGALVAAVGRRAYAVSYLVRSARVQTISATLSHASLAEAERRFPYLPGHSGHL